MQLLDQHDFQLSRSSISSIIFLWIISFEALIMSHSLRRLKFSSLRFIHSFWITQFSLFLLLGDSIILRNQKSIINLFFQNFEYILFFLNYSFLMILDYSWLIISFYLQQIIKAFHLNQLIIKRHNIFTKNNQQIPMKEEIYEDSDSDKAEEQKQKKECKPKNMISTPNDKKKKRKGDHQLMKKIIPQGQNQFEDINSQPVSQKAVLEAEDVWFYYDAFNEIYQFDDIADDLNQKEQKEFFTKIKILQLSQNLDKEDIQVLTSKLKQKIDLNEQAKREEQSKHNEEYARFFECVNNNINVLRQLENAPQKKMKELFWNAEQDQILQDFTDNANLTSQLTALFRYKSLEYIIQRIKFKKMILNNDLQAKLQEFYKESICVKE